jgi:hypothetical protein
VTTTSGDANRLEKAHLWQGNKENSGNEAATPSYPFTTTFIEVVMNREPMPPTGQSTLFTL